MNVLPTQCEYHDVAGECTEECVTLLNGMMEWQMPSVDYDPTGCSYPEPKPYDVAKYDADNRRVVIVTIDPDE